MTKINMGRVILGGLLAGLIVNVSEFILNMMAFRAQMEGALARLNLPPVGTNAIIGFVVFGFLLGIMTIWLYAAIRPRYGASPKTGACAGVAVWFFAYLYPSAGMALMHMFSRRLIAVAVVWGFAEIVIAAVAGAWLYKE